MKGFSRSSRWHQVAMTIRPPGFSTRAISSTYLYQRLYVSYMMLVSVDTTTYTHVTSAHIRAHVHSHLLLLIRHMLARLTRPHYIEAFVGEGHVQSVHHLKVSVCDPAVLGQLCGALDLLLRQGNTSYS